MTVTLEIEPGIEGNLTAQTHARGVSIDSLPHAVIKDLVRAKAVPPASLQELRATIDTLAEMAKRSWR
jgi:hypothetical protein